MQHINSTFFKHKYKKIYLRIYYLYNHDMSILGIFNLKKGEINNDIWWKSIIYIFISSWHDYIGSCFKV